MAVLRMLVLLVLWSALPSPAFVSKLNPNDGPLPCHQTAAMLEGYVRNLYGSRPSPGRANLNAALQDIYLTPAVPPQSWSTEDLNDNVALLNALDALATLEQQNSLIGWMERLCMAWEQNHPQVDTPAEFRARLGLPAQ